MANSRRPFEITSTVLATFAMYEGSRYELQVHICPRRIVLVAAARAAITVHASKVGSWDLSGTVWKWS